MVTVRTLRSQPGRFHLIDSVKKRRRSGVIAVLISRMRTSGARQETRHFEVLELQYEPRVFGLRNTFFV
jgi:hypothetical protein